jgi:hypothetical protein
MVTGLVYSLHCTCHEDGVRYVGQTTRSLTLRLAQHRRAAERGSSTAIVYKWMRRHSPARIDIALLQVLPNCTQDELNAAETAWINHFRGQKTNLLNMWAPFVPKTPVAK